MNQDNERQTGKRQSGEHPWPRRIGLVPVSIGIALLLAFGVRTWHEARFAQRVAQGEIQVETVRGWMTLSYIAAVHGVPEADLRTAIGAPLAGHERRSLRQWLEASGMDAQQGRRAIEAVIVAKGRRPAGVDR